MQPFDTYTIATLLLSIMFSVGGIVLGIGYALDNKRLKDFGENELVQALINGAIIGFIFVLFAPHGLVNTIFIDMASGISLNATCESMLASNPAICFASAYLTSISPITIDSVKYQSLLSISTEMLVSVSAIYVAIAIISSIKLNFIVGISLATVFSPFLSQFNRIISILTTAIIGIETQAILLKFVAVSAIQIILPAGMILRITYFTRRLGGMLIAVAIGLFCVLPMTYLFNAVLISNYSSFANMTSTISLVSLLNSTSKNTASQLQVYNESNSTKGIIGSITATLQNISTDFTDIIRRLSNWVAMLVVEVFLLPILSIMITLISIRELAKVMGSEMLTQFHLGYI
ncbi:MAG: hypothetical protein ACP5TL_01015 [Candidatus Micrarchaeia archaeon]